MKEIFEWPRILMNEQPLLFLLEVIMRSLIMFAIAFAAFRLSGKRGIKQLSVFELVLIVSLGSAAGDPMFYDDVGLIPALTVFVVVIAVYRALTWLITKSSRLEAIVEGKPVYLIKDGKFCVKDIGKNDLSEDEFYAGLRIRSVEHVGQVKWAIVETSGEISVFYYPDDEVKPGLPLLPELCNQKSRVIKEPGLYACTFCANTVQIDKEAEQCNLCGKDEWVPAIHSRRIT